MKLKNIPFVKSILMLLVLLYHSCVFWTGNWWDIPPVYTSNLIGGFATWLNSFHIYTFTLVSGYIFAFKTCGGGIASIFHSYGIK